MNAKTIADRMNEKFAIIASTIKSPEVLKKEIEKEEMNLLEKISDIVDEINEDIRQSIMNGLFSCNTNIVKTYCDKTENKYGFCIVDSIKKLYSSKGYGVFVFVEEEYDDSGCWIGDYYNITITF